MLLAATPTWFVSDPSEMVPVGSRWSSDRARAGTRRSSSPRMVFAAGEVPHRHAVRVRRHHADDPSTWDTSTPVSSGRPSSCEAARTTWRTASPKAVSDSCGRGLARLAHRRELHDRIGVELERGAGGGDGDVVPLVRERHRARLEPPHDVGREPRRNDTTSVVDPDDLVGHLDREIEVGAGDAQRVPGARQQQAQEHGRGATAPTDGTAGGGQHLDECVALGSELHRRQSFREVSPALHREGEVHVSCKGSKGCGLWMTSSSPCAAAQTVSPWPCGPGRPVRGSLGRTTSSAWGQQRRGPQADPAGPQPLPLANHNLADRGPAGRRRQAEPARIFWISSVTCS